MIILARVQGSCPGELLAARRRPRPYLKKEQQRIWARSLTMPLSALREWGSFRAVSDRTRAADIIVWAFAGGVLRAGIICTNARFLIGMR